MVDANGNLVAPCIGGPLDGGTWSANADWAHPGATFVPLKTTVNRPRYRWEDGRWIFDGYEDPDT